MNMCNYLGMGFRVDMSYRLNHLKFLVSPIRSPIILPYIIPYPTCLQEI